MCAQISFPLKTLREYASKYGYFSKEHPIINRVTDDVSDIAIAKEFLELATAAFQDPEMQQQARAEVLAKLFAFREMKVGMKIENYTVDRVFNLCQGIPAFGLTSPTETPLILYRGTDVRLSKWKGIVSIISDFDLRGPGLFLYNRGRSDLRAWIKEHTPRSIGHSLGGVLVFYTLLFEHDLVSHQARSYAFGSPGLYSPLYKKWQEIAFKPPLITVITERDLVSMLGTQIGEVRKYYVGQKRYQAHVALVCAEDSFLS